MADLAFTWKKMESDFEDPDYTKNFLHANLADFTKHKEERPLENIWLLSLKKEKYWLIGRLHVDNNTTAPKINNLKRHWIRFDPNKSEFYSKPLEVQSALGETLHRISKRMFGGDKNGHGSSSLIKVEPFETIALNKLLKTQKKVSFDEFVSQLKSGEISGVPYEKGKLKRKSSSTSAIRSKVINVINSEQLISDDLKNGTAKIEHVLDVNLNGLPDSLNNKGNHRPVSPEEDELRRKKQAENGAEGEELARLFEIERLRDLKCPNPATYINLVAKKDVGLGYDILTTWQETRYIEVKTSASGSNAFFISSNEVEVLTNYKNLAWIYLVDLTKKDDIKNCIRTINNPGDKFNKEIKLAPIQYSATVLNLL